MSCAKSRNLIIHPCTFELYKKNPTKLSSISQTNLCLLFEITIEMNQVRIQSLENLSLFFCIQWTDMYVGICNCLMQYSNQNREFLRILWKLLYISAPQLQLYVQINLKLMHENGFKSHIIFSYSHTNKYKCMIFFCQRASYVWLQIMMNLILIKEINSPFTLLKSCTIVTSIFPGVHM